MTAKVPLTPFTSPTQHIAFSHGSLHPDLPLLTPFPARPNALMHSLLQRALHKPLAPPYPPHPYPGLPRGTTADEARMYGEDGVVWWRGLAIEEDEARVCAWARTLQERLGVRRVVGGGSRAGWRGAVGVGALMGRWLRAGGRPHAQL